MSVTRNKMRGSACVEAAIVMPLLVMFMAGAMDFGRWFNDYMTVSRLAYEAARFGASLPELENCQNTEEKVCADTEVNHMVLKERVLRMIALKDSNRFVVGENGNVTIVTQKVASSSGNRTTLKVDIVVPFEPQFIKILTRVSSHVEAPYLFTGA